MYINPFLILLLMLSIGFSVSFACIIFNCMVESCYMKYCKTIEVKEEVRKEEEEKASKYVIVINPGKNPISLGKI